MDNDDSDSSVDPVPYQPTAGPTWASRKPNPYHFHFDIRILAAIAGVVSVLGGAAGYFISDARNTTRQDLAIVSLGMRLDKVEIIQQVNSEARIRMEEILKANAAKLADIQTTLAGIEGNQAGRREQHNEERTRR